MGKWILTFGFIVLSVINSNQSSAYQFPIAPKFADKELQRAVRFEYRFSKNHIASRDFVHIKKAEWSACHRPTQGTSFLSNPTEDMVRFLETRKPINTLGPWKN